MCATCLAFSLDPANELSKHGYGRCASRPVWLYQSRTARCVFTPSRYSVRAA